MDFVAAPGEPTTSELLAARPHLSMHALDGLLLEGVPLAAIADALGTPVWVYGAATIRARYRRLAAALAGLPAHIHYAVKANDHLAVLALIAAEGGGADVVSEGELLRARTAGIAARDIVFSGVGKSASALAAAVREGVGQINVESFAELEILSSLATAMGATARVALRINPDVAAGTHDKISTGRAGDKFGIAFCDTAAIYARATLLPGIEPVGLALHIGSQIVSLEPYREAYARIAAVVRALRSLGLKVGRVDCGGGLGIGYRDEPGASPEAFAGALNAAFGTLEVELMVEPGRWLVGPAGVLVASVLLTKASAARSFLVLDAAMNDLLRPALYDAWHGIVPLSAVDAVRATEPLDVVGPVCESGDIFARGRMLPPLAPGARVGILDTGAYGAVMSSTYNARPLAAQAMVDGERPGERSGDGWACIRARQELAALWQDELVPDFSRREPVP